MKFAEYRLDREFELIGRWSMDEADIDSGISGILKYSSKKIVLDLIGSFPSEDTNKGFFASTPQRINNLYGFTNSGETIILYDLYLLGSKMNIPGFDTSSYGVNSFVLLEVNYSSIDYTVEKLLNEINANPKEFAVKKVKYNFEYLYEWMNQSVTEVSKTKTRDKVSLIADMNRIHKSTNLIIDNGKSVNFTNNHMYKLNFRRSEKVLTEEVEWNVSFQEESDNIFINLMEYVQLFKQLIQLFLNMPLKYNYIEFDLNLLESIEEESGYNTVKGRYFFMEMGERKVRTPNITFHYTDIVDTFNQTLINWFDKKNLLSFIVNSYLHDLNTKNFIDTTLLNSIRNLEIYHRNFIDSEKETMIDEKLENEKSMLLDFVSKNISEEYVDRFTRNINYNPDMTLRKRLKELFDSLPNEFLEKLIKKPGISIARSRNELITRLIDTRNYLTHGDDETKYPKRLSEPIEMYKTNEILKVILRFFIYKELDIPEDKYDEIFMQDINSIQLIN